MSAQAFPLSAAEVEAMMVSRGVLDSVGSIGALEIVPLAASGATSELYSLELEYRAGVRGPRCAIAKIPVKDDNERLGRLVSAGLFRNEHVAYDILQGTAHGLAECYGSRFDDDGTSILLLQDLRGLRSGDRWTADEPDVRSVVQSVARVQAASYGRDLGSIRSPVWALDATERRADSLMAEFRSEDASVVAGAAVAAAESFAAVSSLLHASADVLVHGDLHLGNVMFADKGECVLIDWQLARQGHGGEDLSKLLVTSFDGPERRSLEPTILDYYQQERREAGRPIDRSQLDLSYRLALAELVLIQVGFGERPRERREEFVRRSAEAHPATPPDMFERMLGRTASAVNDLRLVELVRSL